MERSDRVGCCETQCKEQNKKNFVKELWIYGEPDNVYMHLGQVKLVVDILDDIFQFFLTYYSYTGVTEDLFYKINIPSCKNIFLIIASLGSTNTNHITILLGL
ncbi:hypothetical protein BOTCAL_0103g00060 [Botryotinia calthae]|uniref:Uncharacterized protein n=1 Tax=Botryotinia calthae TaxID=38488 RepID=A0A4Y8D5W4_9HELO|nr:hypothetical protein BOTCAL_0103g00060 [Botryotinia calthae]